MCKTTIDLLQTPILNITLCAGENTCQAGTRSFFVCKFFSHLPLFLLRMLNFSKLYLSVILGDNVDVTLNADQKYKVLVVKHFWIYSLFSV